MVNSGYGLAVPVLSGERLSGFALGYLDCYWLVSDGATTQLNTFSDLVLNKLTFFLLTSDNFYMSSKLLLQCKFESTGSCFKLI